MFLTKLILAQKKNVAENINLSGPVVENKGKEQKIVADLKIKNNIEVETPKSSAKVETPKSSAKVKNNVKVETPKSSVEVETPKSSVEVETPKSSVEVESNFVNKSNLNLYDVKDETKKIEIKVSEDLVYEKPTLNYWKDLLLGESRNKENDVEIPCDFGFITSIKDSVVTSNGLLGVKANELVKFPNDILGVALNLEKDFVRILVFGEIKQVFVGMKILRTSLVLNITVNLDVLGNVVNPLGKSLFSSKVNHKVSSDLTFLPEMEGNFSKKVEVKAPGVIYRKKINEPLETGIKIIDSLVPIGRGQRELILGDRKTGKTSIAIDTILHQKNVLNPVICVYVAIGKRMSEVIRIYNLLKKFDCMKYTCIVVGSISDPASLQYLAPYSGCTIGEFFRDFGYDALVIYDDLTKHADIYRQISLLLRRPVGREAYPGDVFYLHSRLLERSAKLSDDLGSGSLTALPIIETLQGDVSAYIPTNVISITDGQIYLDLVKHQMGIRPAVDPGLSVSRVGSAAQNKIMKKFAGSLKLQLAQFREVEGFSKLGSELDSVTKAILTKGRMYVNLLKQSVNKPCLMVKQIVLLYLANYELIIDFSETELLMLEDFLDLMIAESWLFAPLIHSIGHLEDEDDLFLTYFISLLVILDFETLLIDSKLLPDNTFEKFIKKSKEEEEESRDLEVIWDDEYVHSDEEFNWEVFNPNEDK